MRRLMQIAGWTLIIALAIGIAVFLIVNRFEPWTGFSAYDVPSWDYQRGKTLWDWLSLLIIPIVLLIGGYFLNRSERKRDRDIAEQRTKEDRRIAEERTQEGGLQTYLNQISTLLIDKHLNDVDENGIRIGSSPASRNVARVLTLTILRRLNPERKGTVLKFLYEAGLITKDPDSGNDFCIVHLRSADLVDANLHHANLHHAILDGANLRFASLRFASLRFAHLSNADLSNADLVDALVRGARYNDKTTWPDGFDYEKAGAIHIDLVGDQLTIDEDGDKAW